MNELICWQEDAIGTDSRLESLVKGADDREGRFVRTGKLIDKRRNQVVETPVTTVTAIGDL